MGIIVVRLLEFDNKDRIIANAIMHLLFLILGDLKHYGKTCHFIFVN